MTDQIRKEINAAGTAGRFVLSFSEGDAEITFTLPEAGVLSANHTGVPDALGGRGLALQLVEALVADARAEGYKIIPRCPYVNAQRKRHPEWADLFIVTD